MYTNHNDLVTLPSTSIAPQFRYQLSFFEYCHKLVYGDKVNQKCFIPISNRNNRGQEKIQSLDWNITLPHRFVDTVFDYCDYKSPQINVCGVFYNAKMVLDLFDDNQVVEVQDVDIVHLRPYDGPLPEGRQIIVDNTYENWHMHIGSPNAKNAHIIKPYLKHQDKWYPNGGFNAIVRVGLLKEIIDEVIDVSLEITEKYHGDPLNWWSQMFSLNVACHNNKIDMIGVNNTYYPNVNKLDLTKHHQAHYSVDPIFNKRTLPKVDIKTFPNNLFYNLAKVWITTTQF